MYEREVRQEYAFVSDAAFRAGRAAILETMLTRAQIYTTPWFQNRYERRARHNLARSIATLRAEQAGSSGEA